MFPVSCKSWTIITFGQELVIRCNLELVRESAVRMGTWWISVEGVDVQSQEGRKLPEEYERLVAPAVCTELCSNVTSLWDLMPMEWSDVHKSQATSIDIFRCQQKNVKACQWQKHPLAGHRYDCWRSAAQFPSPSSQGAPYLSKWSAYWGLMQHGLGMIVWREETYTSTVSN